MNTLWKIFLAGIIGVVIYTAATFWIQQIDNEVRAASFDEDIIDHLTNNMKEKGIELGKENKFEFILTIFHPFHLVPKAAVACGKELGIPVIVKIDDAVYQKATGIKSIQRKIEQIYNAKTLQNS